MAQAEPSTDPLYIALTNPVMFLGVPMMFFGANVMVLGGMGFIGFVDWAARFLWLGGVILPLHLLAYYATQKDPHWMSIWFIRATRTPPNRNRLFWKSNSYLP